MGMRTTLDRGRARALTRSSVLEIMVPGASVNRLGYLMFASALASAWYFEPYELVVRGESESST